MPYKTAPPLHTLHYFFDQHTIFPSLISPSHSLTLSPSHSLTLSPSHSLTLSPSHSLLMPPCQPPLP